LLLQTVQRPEGGYGVARLGQAAPYGAACIQRKIADALTARVGYQSAYFDDPRAQ
jgi:hypothetical protein